MNREALRRIEECEETKATKLDLVGLMLTEIPPQLWNLDWLIELLLNDNKITEIEGLEKLYNLNTLYLNDNQISKIEGLEELHSLNTLWLHYNQIEKIEGLEKLNDLKRLDLSTNQISKIEGLEKLSSLIELNLSSNQIQKIEGLEKLSSLKELELYSNQIQKIEGLENLSSLKTLWLNYNKIKKIEGLEKLNSLKELRLHSNQIKKIEGLEKLSSLKTLWLNYNKIQKIEGLEKLSSLKQLNLFSNQTQKIEGLEKLSSLKELSLSSNQIQKIEGLEKLSSLKELGLSSNQIQKIEGLEKLSSLNTLYLESNQIQKIEGLEKLKQLKFLDLQQNDINGLSNTQNWLKSSDLALVWKEKFYSHKDEGINLYDNPIENPPLEFVKQGKQAILNWFEANKKALNEIKVILIGEPKAGKTSLLRRLKHNTFNPKEKQTDGINIETIAFGESAFFKNQTALAGIKAYFWDFGGQEIMSATHQFFLTKRAVYVLVLDARMDKDSPANIKKWIQQIEATGGKASIIVVANQIDVNSGFGFKNESELSEEFPQIKYFLKTSCEAGWETSIENLKEALANLIPKADLFHTEIDERWFPVKEQLQKETKAKKYIDESAFVAICQQHGLKNKTEQESLIRFLHDLGIVLNFNKVLDKANDNLKEYFVLDPYWITYGVYQILTSTYAAQQNGVVAMDKLEYIINEEADKQNTYDVDGAKKVSYSTFQRKFLLEILREFKLCFVKGAFADNCHFIIPDLLVTKEPKNETGIFKDNSDNLSFIYAYEYLPKSILPHIMVETDKYLATYWRSGCLIIGNDCKALIKDYSNKITIEVLGDAIKKKDVLAVIRDLVESINSEQGLKAKRLIPLPQTDETVNYDELVERYKEGETAYKIYQPVKKSFVISELLDGIPATNRMHDERKPFSNKPKLFVSYSGSSEDATHLDNFNTHFRDLERNGVIEKWTDLQIKPGQVRKEVLRQALETADVIVFLVSPDSIASDYIQDIQIKKAIERHKKGDVIIVPIILRPCDFAAHTLSQFQALPKAAKPISTWENTDEAWLDVLQGIKMMIAGIEGKHYQLAERLERVLG